MSPSFVTVVIPFEPARVPQVSPLIARLGNPAVAPQREALDALGTVHFASMSVISDTTPSPAHLVLELSVDDPPEAALRSLAFALAQPLTEIIQAAGLDVGSSGVLDVLLRHRCVLASDWRTTASGRSALGLGFCGSPGVSVIRIQMEGALAALIAGWQDILYGPAPALKKLNKVRAALWHQGDAKWAFAALEAPLLGPARPRTWRTIIQILLAAVPALLWPALLSSMLAALAVGLLVGRAVGFWLATLATGLAEVLILAALAGALYLRLARAEATDIPDDVAPDPAAVDALLSGENFCGLNLLLIVTRLKPGWFRRLTLRGVFWLTGQALARSGRPGFLGDVGVVHFARWLVLPGTDQLLFASNYDGAWDSYLEDFIDLVPYGATAIWTNCQGFPRTRLLFGDGAADGDRFRRYVRRKQIPTAFWYAAYPDLTLEQIRTNAAIRRGIADAHTEAEARAWLSLFGAPR